MSNEIVKLSNQFNNQALRRFNALHLDLLMAIASRMRDKGTSKVDFTFEELRHLAHLEKNLTNHQLAEKIVDTNRRLVALNFEYKDGSVTLQFPLFTLFKTNEKLGTLSVSVNQEFAFLLNDLTSEFTRFELEQFTDLHSTYAKECYRRLKQYRQTGYWKVSIEDFRRLLDVPKSYQTADLNRYVLKPIEDELKDLLHLKVKRVYQKKGSGRGRSSLVGFEFYFDRELTPEQVATIERKAAERKEREEREAKRAEENSKPKFDIEAYKVAHEGRTPWQQAKWQAEQEQQEV